MAHHRVRRGVTSHRQFVYTQFSACSNNSYVTVSWFVKSQLYVIVHTQEGSTAVELKQKISRWQLWRTNKWFQRAKWVAAQALMLAYNFGQYEVVSRSCCHVMWVVVANVGCLYCFEMSTCVAGSIFVYLYVVMYCSIGGWPSEQRRSD